MPGGGGGGAGGGGGGGAGSRGRHHCGGNVRYSVLLATSSGEDTDSLSDPPSPSPTPPLHVSPSQHAFGGTGGLTN